MIRKVVIPAAGLGTRLYPATQEYAKEMLPIFAMLTRGKACLKPLLHAVFEELYDAEFREYCFVVGRDKRSVEDHFTPNENSVLMLKNRDRDDYASDLNNFYTKLKASTIFWVNQPEAKGFGDAVLKSRPFVKDEAFLVHAGDTYFISRHAEHISSLVGIHERLGGDATFLVEEVEDARKYGVVEGNELEHGIYKVKRVVEKPERPMTNLAIVAVYVFHPVIFKALEKTVPDKHMEIQLTDAIQTLVNWGLNIYAVRLDPNVVRLDIGDPDTYWEALSLSHQNLFGHRRQKDKALARGR
jgi:UTP--glucose-1-phosphate uridylyltransferase